MVKYFDTSFIYDYSFPAVTLAYFLRYPNPYSTHVLSTDTLSVTLDPLTNRLTTTRLHHKRSRLPPAIVSLLPRSVSGNVSASGSSSSYILEMSEIDIREGWMRTESRNLDWTAILSVVERQTYQRDGGTLSVEALAEGSSVAEGRTSVETVVKFRSRLGDRIRSARERMADRQAVARNAGVARSSRDEDGGGQISEDDEIEKKGFFASLTTTGIQRSIETIASRRGVTSQGNSKRGMQVVLERLRSGGLLAVLEGMRRDGQLAFGTVPGGNT